jgi:uncharacterized membrane protein
MREVKSKSDSPVVGKPGNRYGLFLADLRTFRLPVFPRTEIDRILTLSMAFSTLMIAARMAYTGQNTFLFLVWNLFLAWLPYAFTVFAQYFPAWQKGKRFAVLFTLWLLFVPNSFYIITDLFHLGAYYTVPLWFDLVMILSFAWNGVLLGLLSLSQMEKMMRRYLPGKNELLFIYPIMWMNAWGIYIGRYMRFNSWDVITNPFTLVGSIVDMMAHPIEYKNAWGMIACFSIFMTLMYIALKKIAKAIH